MISSSATIPGVDEETVQRISQENCCDGRSSRNDRVPEFSGDGGGG